MSIYIREDHTNGTMHVDYDIKRVPIKFTEGVNDEPVSKNSIMVDMEAMHQYPFSTRNFTRYMESSLNGNLGTWTNPYRRPVILHHNEKDGKIIGRVVQAAYQKIKTKAGTPALILSVNIPDKDAIEKVQDGRLSTVSIGVIAHDVRCSICQHQIAELGPCEHERGQSYDGEVCYWDIYEMEAKEVSYVIVPSNIYAGNTRIYTPSGSQTTELTEANNNTKGAKPMDEDLKKAMQDKIDALELEVTRLKEDKTTLETKVTDLEKQVDDLKKEKEALDAVKATLEAQKVEADKEVEDIKATAEQEKQLKESAEQEAIQAKVESKNMLVENYALLRKVLGKKEVDPTALKERSEVSLRDAILDLKEEIQSAPALPAKVDNPDLLSNKDKKDVKEKKQDSNMNLSEELASLFSSAVNLHR